jgi:hypothetical protein
VNSPEPEPNLLALFVRPIHDAGLRYFIAGSVGSMHYSEPRLMLDIDIPLLVLRFSPAFHEKVQPDFALRFPHWCICSIEI